MKHKLIIAAIALFFTQACNREESCITYPEDTKKICGRTHTLLAGKDWYLDSVICNGVNVTQKVFDTLNVDKYFFTIGKTLEDDGLGGEIATAGIVLGDTGHWASYRQRKNDRITPHLELNGKDYLTTNAYSFLYVFGLRRGMENAGKIYKFDGWRLKVGTSTLKDSIVTSFFSAR